MLKGKNYLIKIMPSINYLKHGGKVCQGLGFHYLFGKKRKKASVWFIWNEKEDDQVYLAKLLTDLLSNYLSCISATWIAHFRKISNILYLC